MDLSIPPMPVTAQMAGTVHVKAPARGRLTAGTRFVLQLVDWSRPVASTAATALSLTFAVFCLMSFKHANGFAGVLLATNIAAAALCIVAGRHGSNDAGIGTLFRMLSFFLFPFAPAFIWAANKFTGGPSVDDPIVDPAHPQPTAEDIRRGRAVQTIAPLQVVMPASPLSDASADAENSDVDGASSSDGDATPRDACPLAARPEARSAAAVVTDSWWFRVCLACSMLERTSHTVAKVMAPHCALLGNSQIVVATLVLAVPQEISNLSDAGRAVGAAAVATCVVYQLVVFLPSILTRPPGLGPAMALCLLHDIAQGIGAFASAGTCEGPTCITIGGESAGYTYNISIASTAALVGVAAVAPIFAVAFFVGVYLDTVLPNRRNAVALLAHIIIVGPLAVALSAPIVALLTAALTLFACVPSLTLVAFTTIGRLTPHPFQCPADTMLHVFCEKVRCAYDAAATAARRVGRGGSAGTNSQDLLPPFARSAVLCHGPTAADLHVLRWAASKETPVAVEVRPPGTHTDDSGTSSASDGHSSPTHSGTASEAGSADTPPPAVPDVDHAPDDDEEDEADYQHRLRQILGRINGAPPIGNAAGPSALRPQRRIDLTSKEQRYRVSMAEVAAVLTPFPTRASLPGDLEDSPYTHLTDYLAWAERTRVSDCIDHLETYRASQDPPESPAVDIASAGEEQEYPRPFEVDGTYYPVDLSTETYDVAARGGFQWLRTFTLRRLRFLHVASNASWVFLGGVLPDDWSEWKFRLGYTGAAIGIVIGRIGLFLAVLEPAFNTNTTLVTYVCIAVRVLSLLGIALLGPLLYRTLCRMLCLSLAVGTLPTVDDHHHACVSKRMQWAAECIAAAYDPHVPTLLTQAVPHAVVSRIVVGDNIAPYLGPEMIL